MAKRKPKDDGKKRPPSREKIRYVAIPLNLHEALEKYARDRSDEDDKKSISWAARVAIRRFLTAEGYLDKPSGGG